MGARNGQDSMKAASLTKTLWIVKHRISFPFLNKENKKESKNMFNFIVMKNRKYKKYIF